MSLPLLSAKLIELRHQKEYSQQDIADFLGVTREAYSHYERSTREPNLEIILKLARFYQIEVSELINETTIPIAPNIAVAVPTGKVLGFTSLSIGLQTPKLSKNIHHFLKLFSGKNTSIDYTSITKEDLNILAQYKALDKQSQKEVKDFIKFKHMQNKKNDTAD
ncbi:MULTISPECIES: helix-turn-helix transcriptional regulator [Clostridia]|uniref:helix-turn-helix transcriptional regulator n=1 Tax=Clostridia TaxID=186801 RepID=UPI0015FA4130|nr:MULTISPECIES: helix-turn-helix transcriptional regulator [Clostridia]